MAKNNARLFDPTTLIQAGIDPKTGLPIKFTSGTPSNLENDLRRLFGLIDRQDAFNRFTWYNLPSDLTGDMIERILYYRGQLAFFLFKNKFYALPYALEGNLDIYGRYLKITPLPFSGPSSSSDNGKQKPWIDGLNFEPLYEVLLPDEWNKELTEKKCVLLRDYNNGISQTITPRSILNNCLINVEAEMIPLMRTHLIGSAGVSGLRVNNQDEESNVEIASKSAEIAAKTGKKWIPIVGSMEFQDLNTSASQDANEFMLALNSLDNLRLQTYGLTNGGVFEKQGTILQSENDQAQVNTSLILQDGLTLRQNFCNIVNSLYGTRIWCEINQPMLAGSTNIQQADDYGDEDYTEEEGDNNDEVLQQ